MAISSAFLVGAFLSAYLAKAIVPLGNYGGMGAVLLVQVVGLVASLFMPETIHLRGEKQDAVENVAPFSKKLSAKVAELRVKSVASLREIFWGGNTKLTLLLLSTLFTGVGKHVVGSVMKQYAVKRYELSWVNVRFVSISG